MTPIPGLLLAAVVALPALVLGAVWPVVGAPVLAVLLGVAAASVVRRRPHVAASLEPGVRLAGSRVLQAAVVLLGARLSLGQVASVGLDSLPVLVGTLAAALLAAWLVSRWLGVGTELATLVGVGTAICGASAIAAAAPVLRARGHAVAYATTTILTFNVAAVLVLPPLGHALGLTQADFGLLAGTAVNDTSSVVATASAYGPLAVDEAVVVKLVRSLAIIPVCLVLAGFVRRRERRAATTEDAAGAPGVPWFLVGFLLLATLRSVGVVDAGLADGLAVLAAALVAVALAGIGLSTDPAALRRAGGRPLLMGAILSVVVTVTSLALQTLA